MGKYNFRFGILSATNDIAILFDSLTPLSITLPIESYCVSFGPEILHFNKTIVNNDFAFNRINSLEVKALRKHVKKTLETEFVHLLEVEFDHAVATSKTFKQLARLGGAAPSSEGQRVQRELMLDGLNKWVPKIAEMDHSQRAQLPGISVGRAEQLLAGAIVAQEAMEFLKLDTLEICPWALREGIILRRLDWFPDDAE